MRDTIIIALIFILTSCSDKEVVVQKYDNGQTKVKYTIYKGTEEDLIDVKYQAFFDNGKLMKEGRIKNNSEDGEWKYYFENGKVSSVGNFENGIRTGKFIRYYDTGEIEQEGQYLNGEMTGIKFYFRNGSLKPTNYSVTSLVTKSTTPWTVEQKDKLKKRCNQVLQFDFKNSQTFCDCVIDSTSKYIDFKLMDTLTDLERSSIYESIVKNGACAGLLAK